MQEKTKPWPRNFQGLFETTTNVTSKSKTTTTLERFKINRKDLHKFASKDRQALLLWRGVGLSFLKGWKVIADISESKV